jgi:hypothetical protein
VGLESLHNLCSRDDGSCCFCCSGLLWLPPAAPARQAPPQRSWQSHRFALVIKHRRVKAHRSNSRAGTNALWSFMCEGGTELNTPTAQWACIPAAWESPTRRPNAPVPSWGLGRFRESANSASHAPLSIFGSSSHGVRLLPCNLAPTMTWGF